MMRLTSSYTRTQIYKKQGLPPGHPQLETFFLEREYLLFYSLKIFTFHHEGDQVTSIISLSIYIVYYYISYIIRNIIKLIKRRDIDKREKGKETRFSLVTRLVISAGHLRKSPLFLRYWIRKICLLFNTEHKTLWNVIAPAQLSLVTVVTVMLL